MELSDILKIYSTHPGVNEITSILKQNNKKSIYLSGLIGSSAPLVVSQALKDIPENRIFILNDREEAAYFYDDLNTLGFENQSLFFPSSYKRSVQYEKIEPENIILRTEVLNQLSSLQDPISIVTYPEALLEKVISGEGLEKNTLHIKTGEKLSTEFIREILCDYKFEKVDFVYEPGQYSIRGSIVDIFSYANDDPYRIDFFGDEVDSIRTFDIENQLSKVNFNKIAIIPNIQKGLNNENKISFFDFLPNDTILFFRDIRFTFDQIESIFKETTNKFSLQQKDADKSEIIEQICSGNELLQHLNPFTTIEFGSSSFVRDAIVIRFNNSKQPVFNKNFDLLCENLLNNIEKGYRNIILSTSVKQIERLRAIFHDIGESIEFESLPFVLNEGFVDHDLQLCCYTDHQIFERYHRFKLQTKKSSLQAVTLKELNKLHPGDYVVHVDHGIGKFGGLVKTEVNGKIQEAIRLFFRDNDMLLVSIHSLHRISKYKGKDSTPPKINKLGSGAWQKLKNKTKNKVKDIARELIALYAHRREEKGFAFSPDSYLQQELEASFIYEDTPDQLKSTNAVKEDMEKNIPMDRLVCGDVGFGKTEVAIRAAFKAVADNKQVAILVPTTILAFQHFKTFRERLENFPCNIEYISRLRKPGDIKKALGKLKEGQVDIIIGAHRLVGKDVKFKNLGLLIIDEEQKFGVSVKEKLKRLKLNVDTLTLTATPIPRTLQFSLMGARDLSIINTPPPNRYPIFTEVHGFNEEIIREAINYETERNGQVFFIHNRVQNILEVEAMVNRICPDVRTVVGHGQMDGSSLEKVMLGFINGDYDVLIATTIIESGLDIPNANTIIINHAQNFGLSDLHQLRGRVGRSNKKAFCYLLAPPLSSLTTEARRRLRAIEEFSDLGSGFNIAMQDLDIRGAGNLLGGEQSGFIADIGFETYHRILSEAVQELKQEEFSELYKEEDETKTEAFLKIKYTTDCHIDTDLQLLFPDPYISNISERMLLYRQLDNLEKEEKLKEFELNLIDRFGPLPQEAKELLDVVRLRWIAIELGIEKIILKRKKLICHFISQKESPFYQSPLFMKILNFLQQYPGKCRMRENPDKLSLIFEKVHSMGEAHGYLTEILDFTKKSN